MKEVQGNVGEHLDLINNSDKYGITIIRQSEKTPVDINSKYLLLKGSEVEMYLNNGHLTEQNVRTIDGEFDNSYELKNGEKRYYHYYVPVSYTHLRAHET